MSTLRRRHDVAIRWLEKRVRGALAPATALLVAAGVSHAAGGGTPAKRAETRTARPAAQTAPGSATSGAPYTLKGDREGTVFQSLTVEGEDRVHVEFDRPELEVDLDLQKAPGLEWGSARDVLDRTRPDAMAPLQALVATEPPRYLAHPWLDAFASGAVARFHPQVEGVERWRLLVADSHGKVVAQFGGKERPPSDIAWDGRTTAGTPVTPGLTYSYVFEAYDRAGNKRNFVGEGFTVASYRLDTPAGPVLTFGGGNLGVEAGITSRPAAAAPPPILVEAASWLNQSAHVDQPLRIVVSARTADQAQALADRVTHALASLVIGDPARLRAVTQVQPDAPEAGTVTIGPAVSGTR
jgi:hypothetical protein